MTTAITRILLAERWDKLLATVRWIEERQAPGKYLRQIDVPGVDTKFIERTRASSPNPSTPSLTRPASGFAIVNRLRRRFPHARSMLMDRATSLAHRDHWTTEPSPTTAVLDRLDPSESALYAELISDAHASSVRLEQERISFSAVEKAIAGRR